jgi:hypothetical protein
MKNHVLLLSVILQYSITSFQFLKILPVLLRGVFYVPFLFGRNVKRSD